MQICVVAIITLSLALFDLRPTAGLQSPTLSLIGCIVAQMLLALSALHVVRQTRREANSRSFEESDLNRNLDFRVAFHFAVWFCAILVTLTCFHWPQFCAAWCEIDFAARLLVLLPAVLSWLLSWTILFLAEKPASPSFSATACWSYVVAQSRLYLILPLLLILFVVTCQDVADSLMRSSPHQDWAIQTIRVVPLITITMAFPLLLRITWKTESLAAGKLRDRLEGCCNQLNFKKRDILIWHTDKRMRNAAVSGILPSWRYVLLSDRLISDLPENQVEAVFLHEVAHAFHRHHLRLTGISVLLMCAGVGALASGLVFLGLTGLALGLWVIGCFAKLFELQADLWAAKQGVDFPFDYLSAIANISQGSVDQRGWMHPSFRERTEFLLLGEMASQRLSSRIRHASLIAAIIGGTLVLSQCIN